MQVLSIHASRRRSELRRPLIRIELRIALGLVSIFLSLLFCMDLIFDLRPNRSENTRQLHLASAHNIAVLLTQRGSEGKDAIPYDMLAALARNDPKILSLGLRDPMGKLTPIVGDHDAHWTLPEGARSTIEQIRIPIREGTRVWGYLEVAFKPEHTNSTLTMLRDSGLPILALLGVISSILVYLYLRRMLQHLDPSQVVPQRVRDAFDVLDEGMIILDAKGRVMMVNSALRKLDPGGEEVRIGRQVDQFEWLIEALKSDAQELPWIEALQSGVNTVEREILIKAAGKDGLREVVIKAAPVVDSSGQARGSLVTLIDVSALHRLNRELQQSMRSLTSSREQLSRQNEELHRLATCDPLTNCLNRRAFFELAERALSEARTLGTAATCIMVDIDHFKSVNDQHGHSVGDQVIKAVAGTLSQGVRGTDFVCRYGGEEFCVLLTQLDVGGAMQIAERLRDTIETTAGAQIESVPGMRVTASIGVAQFTPDVERLEVLIERADQMLYHSKRNGRNRVTPWTAGDKAQALHQPPSPSLAA